MFHIQLYIYLWVLYHILINKPLSKSLLQISNFVSIWVQNGCTEEMEPPEARRVLTVERVRSP